MTITQDEQWMRRALAVAERGGEAGEVPVGAVLVRDGEVLGEGFNAPISGHDPSGHAEINALRAACQAAGNYRLPGATLYVTLEPCMMCAGALVHARISRLVFGAREPKAGAVCSQARLLERPELNWQIEVVPDLLGEQCSSMLSAWFANRRAQNHA